MPLFEVCIVESREYVFEVEAEDESEAESIANDLEVDDAKRDQFRQREHDWTTKL